MESAALVIIAAALAAATVIGCALVRIVPAGPISVIEGRPV